MRSLRPVLSAEPLTGTLRGELVDSELPCHKYRKMIREQYDSQLRPMIDRIEALEKRIRKLEGKNGN